jgi:hypothetical protein
MRPPAAPDAASGRSLRSFVRAGLGSVGAVLVPWAATRAIVLGALALAHLTLDRTHPAAHGVAYRVHQGLLGWDAGWYQSIAGVGYGRLGHQSLRFFPLYPLAGRALAHVPGITDGAALLIIANLASLLGTAMLFVLVRRELGDAGVATNTVWLLSLAPAAFTFVMGYAEGLLLLWTTACFLALRPASGRRAAWWWAAVVGAAAGATRPLGVLLVLPAGVEAVRTWRSLGARRRVAAVAAVLGPVAGVGAYLGWSRAANGDFWEPLRVQAQGRHHGGLSNPLRTLADDARGVLHHHFGTALHVPWVLVAVGLLVVCWWRLPPAYGAFATGVVLLALAGTNLDSFERYALSAFPLVMSAATLVRRPSVARPVMVLAAAVLAGYALLSFLNLSVP